MSRIRDLMRNPKVAAGVAAVAVLFIVYRIAGIGKGKGSSPTPALTSRTVPSAPSTTAPAAPVSSGTVTEGSAARSPATALPTDVPWSWDRNPFVPKGAHGAGIGGDTVPGIGKEGEGLAAVNAGGGLPGEFRGTIVSGISGMAIFGTRLAAQGERIGDWTLERVEHARVVLRRGKETRVLEIFKTAPPGR